MKLHKDSNIHRLSVRLISHQAVLQEVLTRTKSPGEHGQMEPVDKAQSPPLPFRIQIGSDVTPFCPFTKCMGGRRREQGRGGRKSGRQSPEGDGGGAVKLLDRVGHLQFESSPVYTVMLCSSRG